MMRKIGFSNRTLNGAFFNGLTENMKISAKAAGYDIITTDAAGNMNKQISDVEDMLSQGIDILVLNPQDPAAGVNIAKKAAAKKAAAPKKAAKKVEKKETTKKETTKAKKVTKKDK